MKLLRSGILIVTGLSFYNPKFIMVFSIIMIINLVTNNHNDFVKIAECFKNKQQLLLLKRINADIEQEIKVCYLNIGKHSKDKSN